MADEQASRRRRGRPPVCEGGSATLSTKVAAATVDDLCRLAATRRETLAETTRAVLSAGVTALRQGPHGEG
jgi:hypothetical protein